MRVMIFIYSCVYRPPLPPKLKQWSAKSFDSEWPPPSHRTVSPSGGGGSPHHQLAQLANSSSANLSPHHQSLLAQWLEQATPITSHHPHHHRSLSQHQARGRLRQQQLHSTSSSSRYDCNYYCKSVWHMKHFALYYLSLDLIKRTKAVGQVRLGQSPRCTCPVPSTLVLVPRLQNIVPPTRPLPRAKERPVRTQIPINWKLTTLRRVWTS